MRRRVARGRTWNGSPCETRLQERGQRGSTGSKSRAQEEEEEKDEDEEAKKRKARVGGETTDKGVGPANRGNTNTTQVEGVALSSSREGKAGDPSK